MAIPLLATKLYAPPPPPKAVIRARLIARLNEGLAFGRRLTRIAALSMQGASGGMSSSQSAKRRE
jgi:LuxR family maltose regulon positive regulatory protein